MIRTIVIGLSCLCYVMSMTTTHHPHHTGGHGHHHTGPTHEPTEHENFKFTYEPITHMMLIATAKNCYMFALSDSERASIHTDTGIRTVELKLLSTLSSAAVTEVDKAVVDKSVAHRCGNVDHYYKETV